MSNDIGEVLRAWPYNRINNIRKIIGDDGKEKIQVRLPLGIEQFEVDGRPDGKRPYGKESLFEYYKSKLEAYEKKNGTDEGFSLTVEDCSRLYEEGLLYYYRYVLFFQIRDYEKVATDTQRNMEYFDFVKRYAIEEEDKVALEQYRPYIIRMNALGKGLSHLEKKEYDNALREIEEGIRVVDSLPDMDNSTFTFEKTRSLTILREMVEEINRSRPVSEKEILQKKLQEAIREENYERAAELRDRLRELEGTESGNYKRRHKRK